MKKQVTKEYIQMLTLYKVKRKAKQYCLGIHTNVVIYEIKEMIKKKKVPGSR